jgi:putative ABC transport system substrate-binding protein
MGERNAIGRRRAIVALSVLSMPLAALAQAPPAAGGSPASPTVYRIGFLVPRSSAAFTDRVDAFRDGMRQLGYIEGRNLAIEWRFADGDYHRLPKLAGELVQAKVDVLVVDSTPGVKAAAAATSTLPIVMVSVGDPVASGFVASLARPGRNITGLSNVVGDVSSKYVELLQLAVPGLTSMAVLTNPDNSTHAPIAAQMRAAAKEKGIGVTTIPTRIPADIDAAFTTIHKQRLGAAVALGDPFFGQQARQIAELALKARVPTLMTNRALAQAGALMSYGQDLTEHYRRVATYVDKLLKGARPADLPIEQSTKIELVVNLKTAKALGLALPPAFLLRADDVIQ